MSPPVIAFDVTPLQNAHRFRGIGTYVRGLAGRLSAQVEVPIEFWGWDGESRFVAPPPHRNVWLARLPMPQYRAAWLFARLAMRRRASLSAVRAVHITDPDALTPLRGRQLFATVYDLIPLNEGLDQRRLIAWAGYRSYLKALKQADTVFAISAQTAGDLIDLLRLPANRIRLAPPGVDLPPTDGQPTSHQRPYFLYLGGPNPNKNLSTLLDAMTLCADLPEELLIAGHWLPKQIAALNRQIEARGLSGRARPVGFVPSTDISHVMRGATALVIPSLREGFGLPVAEGLAVGAVVVHSRLPVLEDVSAGNALIFDPSSGAELAACLHRAASDRDLTNDLRRRGIGRAEELTWDVAVETTLSAYRDVLK